VCRGHGHSQNHGHWHGQNNGHGQNHSHGHGIFDVATTSIPVRWVGSLIVVLYLEALLHGFLTMAWLYKLYGLVVQALWPGCKSSIAWLYKRYGLAQWLYKLYGLVVKAVHPGCTLIVKAHIPSGCVAKINIP
jgi:hypothetical protein